MKSQCNWHLMEYNLHSIWAWFVRIIYFSRLTGLDTLLRYIIIYKILFHLLTSRLKWWTHTVITSVINIFLSIKQHLSCNIHEYCSLFQNTRTNMKALIVVAALAVFVFSACAGKWTYHLLLYFLASIVKREMYRSNLNWRESLSMPGKDGVLWGCFFLGWSFVLCIL